MGFLFTLTAGVDTIARARMLRRYREQAKRVQEFGLPNAYKRVGRWFFFLPELVTERIADLVLWLAHARVLKTHPPVCGLD